MTPLSPVDHCAELLRQHDYERYVTVLFAPAQERPALWVLHALNYEFLRIRQAVREPMMGLIRLQWWRDGIAAIYAGPQVPAHPVLQALAQLKEKFDKNDIRALVQGYESQFHEPDQFWQQAGEQSFPLLKILAPTADPAQLKLLGECDQALRLLRPGMPVTDIVKRIETTLAQLNITEIKNQKLSMIYNVIKWKLKRLKKAGNDITVADMEKRIFMLPLYLWLKSL